MRIQYAKGYKYQLRRPAVVRTWLKPPEAIRTDFISLATDGTLKIAKGYAWDGPSGPCPDFERFMAASVVHDSLYQLIRMELLLSTYRPAADREFARIATQDGTWAIVANAVGAALTLFGKKHAHPSNRKKTLSAGKALTPESKLP